MPKTSSSNSNNNKNNSNNTNDTKKSPIVVTRWKRTVYRICLEMLQEQLAAMRIVAAAPPVNPYRKPHSSHFNNNINNPHHSNNHHHSNSHSKTKQTSQATLVDAQLLAAQELLTIRKPRTTYLLRLRIGVYLFQLQQYQTCIEHFNLLANDVYDITDVKERKRETHFTADHFFLLHLLLGRANVLFYLTNFDATLLTHACEEYQEACQYVTLDLAAMLRLPGVLLEYARVLEVSRAFQNALTVYGQILSQFPTFKGYFDALYRTGIVGLHLATQKKQQHLTTMTPATQQEIEEAIDKSIDIFQFLLEALPVNIEEIHIVLLYMRAFEMSFTPQQKFRALGVVSSLYAVCRKKGVAINSNNNNTINNNLDNNLNNNNSNNILETLTKAARDKEQLRNWTSDLSTWMTLGRYCLRRPMNRVSQACPETHDTVINNNIKNNNVDILEDYSEYLDAFNNIISKNNNKTNNSINNNANNSNKNNVSGVAAVSQDTHTNNNKTDTTDTHVTQWYTVCPGVVSLAEEDWHVFVTSFEPLLAYICFFKYEEEAKKLVPPNKDISLVVDTSSALYLAHHFFLVQQDVETSFYFTEVGLHRDRYNRALRGLLSRLKACHLSSSSSGQILSSKWSDDIQKEIDSASKIVRCWKHRIWTSGFRRKLKENFINELLCRVSLNRYGDTEARHLLSYYARDTWRHVFLYEELCARKIQKCYKMFKKHYVWRETQRRHTVSRANELLHRFQQRPFSPRTRVAVLEMARHRHVSRRHPIVQVCRIIEQQQKSLHVLVKCVKVFLFQKEIKTRVSRRLKLIEAQRAAAATRIQHLLKVVLAKRLLKRLKSEQVCRDTAARVLQKAFRRYRILKKRHFFQRRLRRMHQKQRHSVMRQQVMRATHRQLQQQGQGSEKIKNKSKKHNMNNNNGNISDNEKSEKTENLHDPEKELDEVEEDEDLYNNNEEDDMRMLLSSSASAASILKALQFRSLTILRRLFAPYLRHYVDIRRHAMTQHARVTQRFHFQQLVLRETQLKLVSCVKIQRFYRARVANFWFSVTRKAVRQRRRRRKFRDTDKDRQVLQHVSRVARHCIVRNEKLYETIVGTQGETQLLQQWRWPGTQKSVTQSQQHTNNTFSNNKHNFNNSTNNNDNNITINNIGVATHHQHTYSLRHTYPSCDMMLSVSETLMACRDTLVFVGTQDCTVQRLQLLGLVLTQRQCHIQSLLFVDCDLFQHYGDALSDTHDTYHDNINNSNNKDKDNNKDSNQDQKTTEEALEVFFTGLCRAVSLRSLVILGGTWSNSILKRLFRLIQIENPRIVSLCVEQVSLGGGTADLLCHRANRVLCDFFNYALSSSSTLTSTSTSSHHNKNNVKNTNTKLQTQSLGNLGSLLPIPMLHYPDSSASFGLGLGNLGNLGGLASSLGDSTSLGGLCHLSLHGCGLWDSHVSHLTEGLSVTAALQTLTLSLNLLTDEGMLLLMAALQRNKRQPLQLLDLQHNLVRLSHRPLRELLHAFRNIHDNISNLDNNAYDKYGDTYDTLLSSMLHPTIHKNINTTNIYNNNEDVKMQQTLSTMPCTNNNNFIKNKHKKKNDSLSAAYGGGETPHHNNTPKRTKPTFPLSLPPLSATASHSNKNINNNIINNSTSYRSPCVIDLRHNPIAETFDCVASAVTQKLPASQLVLLQDIVDRDTDATHHKNTISKHPLVNNNNSRDIVRHIEMTVTTGDTPHDTSENMKNNKKKKNKLKRMRRTESFASFASNASDN